MKKKIYIFNGVEKTVAKGDIDHSFPTMSSWVEIPSRPAFVFDRLFHPDNIQKIFNF